MKYLIDSYSHVGGRSNNEDSYKTCESSNGLLLVVADGLGGHDNGEIASSMAVDSLCSDFQNESFDLEDAIKSVNLQIVEKQNETGLKMKTTITVVWIKDDKTFFAHVGDSRIYAFKNKTIVFQSVDHSSSQMAVSIGEIKPEEIRNHPDRNILTRALGVAETVKVDITEFNTEDFDSVLLCTDGFWEYVIEDEMIKHRYSSKNPDVWIYKMREELTRRIPANNDNNTAIAMIIKGD